MRGFPPIYGEVLSLISREMPVHPADAAPECRHNRCTLSVARFRSWRAKLARSPLWYVEKDQFANDLVSFGAEYSFRCEVYAEECDGLACEG